MFEVVPRHLLELEVDCLPHYEGHIDHEVCQAHHCEWIPSDHHGPWCQVRVGFVQVVLA